MHMAWLNFYYPGSYFILERTKTLYSKLVTMFKNDDKVLLYNFGWLGRTKKFILMFVVMMEMQNQCLSLTYQWDLFNSSPLTSAYKKEVKWYAVDLITVKCAGCEIKIMKELIAIGIQCQIVNNQVPPLLQINRTFFKLSNR